MLRTQGNMSDLKKFEDAEKDERQRQLMQQYDKRLLSWLGKMHKMLNKDEIPVEDFQDAIKLLDHIKKGSESKYLKNLVYPEDANDAKIPTRFPVPSSSFQLHSSFMTSTNAAGNVSGYLNPWFLGNSGESSFYVNNDATLTGNSASNFFTNVEAGQNVPAYIYTRYRLVSLSLQVSYVGRWDIVSGMVGGAITFDPAIGDPSAVGTVELAGARYGQYDLIDDSYFSYRTQAINGLRLIYVPIDPSQEEYQTVGQELRGECIHFYGQGLPPSSPCLRVDIYANYECLADASFQNYIPSTSCSGKADEVRTATKVLSENKDLAISSMKNYEEKKPSILKTLLGGLGVLGNAAGNFLPGGAAIAKVLPSITNSIADMVD